MSLNLVVQRRRAERFVMVPNDVVAMLATGELTPAAFAALVVVMSKPDGWNWSAPGIAAASGLGRDAWRAARRVLLKVGAITGVRRPRLVNGRVCGSVFEVDWPPVHRETGNPSLGAEVHRETGLPAAGEPVPVGTGNPSPSLRQTPAAGAAPQARRRRPPGKAAAESPKPEPVEVVAPPEPPELVELGPSVDLKPSAVEVGPLAVQERVPSLLARTAFAAAVPRPDPVPEVLEFLASRNRPYHARR